MHKVRITAKPQYTQNYITVKLAKKPAFDMEGHTLTGIRMIDSDDVKDKTVKPVPIPVPETTEEVANGAFSGLDFLHGVFLRYTPYRLGCGVFAGCTGLEAASLAEGTEKIPLETFSDCKNLRAVYLPDSVKRINVDAFKNCSALRRINFPPALEVIEAAAFWGCHSLDALILPDSVTEIWSDAFANCTGLTRVQLPASLQKIGSCAFQNCSKLERIEIPEGVTSLPMGVFAGCRNLKHIVLPETMEYISPYAFYRCDALEYVECTNTEQFEQALECTPFWQKNWMYPEKPHRFPMELLNQFAGEVPGSVLSAMGHPLFDIDKKYQFFLSDYPGVIQVRSRWLNAEYPQNADYDEFLINDAFEPIPDIRPLIDAKDCVAIF